MKPKMSIVGIHLSVLNEFLGRVANGTTTLINKLQFHISKDFLCAISKNSVVVQGQLLNIWHRMLIYHTAWICGP